MALAAVAGMGMNAQFATGVVNPAGFSAADARTTTPNALDARLSASDQAARDEWLRRRSTRSNRYPSNEGWTNARYRRAAAKRRRVQANRRAHRG